VAYVSPSFGDGDPTTVVDRMLAAYQVLQPGWQDLSGDPLGAVLRAVGGEIDVLRALISDAEAGVFATFGRTVIQVPSAVETKATVQATVTFSDSAGHTFPAGTDVTWTDPTSGQVLEFRSLVDVPVPAGATSASVTFEAAFPGSAYNSVPTGSVLLLSDVVAGVSAITTSVPSTGGTDPETDDAYRDILTDDLKTLRLSVLNAFDAAILARNVPGVHRAFALDGWNPVTNTVGTDTTDVGIAMVNAAGADVPTSVKDAAVAYLNDETRRGLNVTMRAGSPTYTAVNIVFTAVADYGYDPVAVQASAVQAVRDFIDPANFSGGLRQPPEWQGDKVIRRLDVAGVIARVPGMGSLTTLTLNGSATVDITLAMASRRCLRRSPRAPPRRSRAR
jgi:uncharacterized phage protein gp47/JayE